MFSISLIEILDKLSFVLLAPLVTVAILIDFPSSYTAESGTVIHWFGRFVWAFAVAIAIVAILVTDYAIVYLDTYFFEDRVLPLAGCSFWHSASTGFRTPTISYRRLR
jgi:hypothetical protein